MKGEMLFPKDILYSLPNIKLIGNEELCIENFKSIIEYKEDRLLIRMKKNNMLIIGNNLCISKYSKDELIICGLIKEIKYL